MEVLSDGGEDFEPRFANMRRASCCLDRSGMAGPLEEVLRRLPDPRHPKSSNNDYLVS